MTKYTVLANYFTLEVPKIKSSVYLYATLDFRKVISFKTIGTKFYHHKNLLSYKKEHYITFAIKTIKFLALHKTSILLQRETFFCNLPQHAEAS